MEKYLRGRLNCSPFCRHSTDESSLDRRVVTRPTSRHSIDESSLDRRVVTRPTSPHSTDESSLDRRVLTRPTSPHSTNESSLDRQVLTRPASRHSTVLSSLGAERSLAVARLDLSRLLGADRSRAFTWLDLSRSLARSPYSAQNDLSQSLRSLSPRGVDVSIQQQGLAEAYPYLTYPSWLHDESSRKQLVRALAVTRLDLSRSLGAVLRGHSTRSLVVTLLGSLSRSHSDCSQVSSMTLSIDTSSMTTCSGGSEHCPHRSFAQPSRSKKSDRNQKYVDDNLPETVRL
ncbi:hypothetical protein YC2023_018035 [Brassica napus]